MDVPNRHEDKDFSGGSEDDALTWVDDLKAGKTLLSLLVLVVVFMAGVALPRAGFCADPLTSWTWRNPSPQGSTLYAVTYGGGQFVAVGDNGAVVTSPDGLHWRNQTLGVSTLFRGIAYADGVYAAVGDRGAIFVSSNAVTWTQISSTTTNALRGIAGNSFWRTNGQPQFLAVGDNGTLVSATNAMVWANQNAGITNDLRGAIYNDGAYEIIGDAGTFLQYTTHVTALPDLAVTNYAGVESIAMMDPLALTYGNGSYIFGGSVTIEASYPVPLGIILNGSSYIADFPKLNADWTGTGLGIGGYTISGVTFGDNVFVSVGYPAFTLDQNYSGLVGVSNDGNTWTGLSYGTSENWLFGVTYANGLFVAVGAAGSICVSTNGTNWTDVTGYHRSAITAIACSDNLCVASASPIGHMFTNFPDFTTVISTNGQDWFMSNRGLPPMADMVCGGGQIVGVDGIGIYSTSDGQTWQNNTFTNTFRGIGYANGRFIAVGDNGTILTSTDAAVWSNSSLVTTGAFRSVAFGGGLYVAAGTIDATSTDGSSWQLCASNPPVTITRIAYGKGLFVAANFPGYFENGSILTSKDGLTWQTQFTTQNASITGLAYTGGTFLGITSGGSMFTSVDGTNWRSVGKLPLVDGDAFSDYYTSILHQLFGESEYSTVCALNGTFLAGTLDGILLQSGNVWTPAALSAPQFTPNGFSFSYNQQVDVPFRIQISTNLVDWQDRYSGIGTGQPTNFLFGATSNSPQTFFRIVSP
jgi:hypothetical protein